MGERLGELDARGAAVLVVSFAEVERLPAYQQMLGLPFPIAADPERASYQAWGLERGTWWQRWHPRTIWRYIKLVRGGMKLQAGWRDEDLSQLGGDFVVDGEGVVRFAHRSERPDDRPPAQALLAALDGA